MLHFEGKIWHLVRAFSNWQKCECEKADLAGFGRGASDRSGPLGYGPATCSPLKVGPVIAAKGFGALKLHQRVRAEPGRQTPSGAFSGYLNAVFGKYFHANCPWYFLFFLEGGGNFVDDSNDSQYSARSTCPWHHSLVCLCTLQPAAHQQSRESW